MSKLHCCEECFDSARCGPAVNYCQEYEDGTLVVGNSEYESMVNFCPFCGYKAKKEVEGTDGGTHWTAWISEKEENEKIT